MTAMSRLGKPDFAPRYKEHRKILEKNGLDAEEMIAMRKNLHKNPEGGFKEFNTQKVIREKLLKLGVPAEKISDCVGTGLVVDICGTGEGTVKGIKTIAIRADMDGLPMPENNPHLEYVTQTKFAHMCGHDGHMSTVTSVAQVLMA